MYVYYVVYLQRLEKLNFVESVALHIVSLFCACVSNTITHYHISSGLRYAHRDVWGKPILRFTGKQVGLCVSTCNWLLLATLVVDIETLGS